MSNFQPKHQKCVNLECSGTPLISKENKTKWFECSRCGISSAWDLKWSGAAEKWDQLYELCNPPDEMSQNEKLDILANWLRSILVGWIGGIVSKQGGDRHSTGAFIIRPSRVKQIEHMIKTDYIDLEGHEKAAHRLDAHKVLIWMNKINFNPKIKDI